ncbi:hypothetical protein [Saccharothrix texasensis]|uniref:HNH endonuclease n=1 Tax=Saccharothrix texasensis TaxID=103734 RepID=A0A3N1H4M5_9PSEU|nr:hypothetical protein [Saccharothrix texasensis]ROP37172.1 hypothetical protein EDD40_2461 [Saccharothrix texasensis]
MRVALQPATLEGDVLQHYRDTIEKPVVFDDHADVLDPAVLSNLHRLFPEGRARMWGVTPGDGDANVGKVARLRAGDFVLFYGRGVLYLAGTVALRWHNRALAARLWTYDRRPVPQTWEHMYALTDVRQVQIPIDEVRPLLGWGPRAVVQGFNIYDGGKAAGLRELCNLALPDEGVLDEGTFEPDALPPPHQPFDGPTDGAREGAVRLEQQQFKRRLGEIGGGRCALCDRPLPLSLLVAAHIKKRAKCSEEERLDFDNVGMLACVFGCDALYERGYVSVSPAGDIMISAKVAEFTEVEAMVQERLKGRRTSWWTPERDRYYQWHRTHRFLRML